jgi:uncharacterized membrane protein YccC
MVEERLTEIHNAINRTLEELAEAKRQSFALENSLDGSDARHDRRLGRLRRQVKSSEDRLQALQRELCQAAAEELAQAYVRCEEEMAEAEGEESRLLAGQAALAGQPKDGSCQRAFILPPHRFLPLGGTGLAQHPAGPALRDAQPRTDPHHRLPPPVWA